MIGFSGYFRDGAIVQRGEPVGVSGYAKAGGEVVCTLCGGEYGHTTVAITDKNGRFFAEFPAVFDTENEFILTAVCEGEAVSVKISFGDVYLTMGQSNMSYALSATEEYEGWAERAKACRISLLSLDEKPFASTEEVTRPPFPLEDFSREYRWISGEDEELKNLSAISVQTAVLLNEKTKVPVGIVHTSMGGLSVEAYLPRECVEGDEKLLEFTKRVGRYQTIGEYNRAGERNFTQLGGVWNEKLAPLSGRRFKGFVWYLGESSACDFEFASMFFEEMKLVIKNLRGTFGNLPFVAVHIAPEYYPYGDGYGYEYINEALTRLEEEVTDVCSLPIYDVEPRWLKTDGALYYHPIHPVNKAPVSERVAAALSGGRFRYPRIASVDYTEDKAVCTVENAGGGLVGERYRGFILAGRNGKYYPATARRLGADKIEVSSPDVREPAALAYAFMQYQDFCNVRALDGAPLLPYRTTAEPVNENYCFPPAYLEDGALEVYENNFGWQVGTAHKVPVWKSGEIYGGKPVKIGSDGEAVYFAAEPGAEDYFLFGISPALCLAGHRHHLSDFAYLNFCLKAQGGTELAEFLGVAVRRADGEIFRAELMNGTERADSLPVGGGYAVYCVSLERGCRGDGAPLEFTREERKSFVQAEFCFRSKAPVTVYLKGVLLSDKNLSEPVQKRARAEESRADVQLPK